MKADEVIRETARLCRNFGAKEVILYGSRAKGTARERSDIDVAVTGVNNFDELREQVEELPTLYSVDLVNMDTCRNQLLLEDIRKYGRKFNKRFQFFCNSLDALAEARQRDLADSFVLSGTGAKFSITFDLAWKVMKDILVQYYAITGFVTGSPREVLREAYKANLISDDAWMDMLKVRNALIHDYDCEIVKTHCTVIVEKYIDLFYDFEYVVKQLDI